MFDLEIKNELFDLVWWIAWLTHCTTLITIEFESLQKGGNSCLNAWLLHDELLALFPAAASGKSYMALQRDGEWRLSLSFCYQVLCSASLYTSNSNSQIPIWLPNDGEEPKYASKVHSDYSIFILTSSEISKLSSRPVCAKYENRLMK